MAVPISPIDLQDVKNEIGLSSSATLQDCVNNASSSGFDSNYQSSSDPLSAPYDLLDFRNYNHNLYTGTMTAGSDSSGCEYGYKEIYYGSMSPTPSNFNRVINDTCADIIQCLDSNDNAYGDTIVVDGVAYDNRQSVISQIFYDGGSYNIEIR